MNIKRILFAMLALAGVASAETLEFKRRCLADLISQTPRILASQDKKTGRFGEGIWIVTDQIPMLALAAVWSQTGTGNRYYHSREVLAAIMAAGDALIDDQDQNGQWEFRKKDGSTWGKIHMPWIYSRWIRSFSLVRSAMPSSRRARWEKALLLGYTGIAKDLESARLHNIPSHHAMGLWFAAKLFGKPAWSQLSRDYLRRIAAAQHADGYWSENKGPVVTYGFVYVDALGTYYSASKDAVVLPALRKSAAFHYYFTYPDGSDVETVDERNPYHAGVRIPNAGFTFSPEGRSYAARQLRLQKEPIPADEAAILLLWGQEGPGSTLAAGGDFDYTLPSGEAAVRRRGPWFLAVSAMTAPIPNSRWIQDRQNFVSVFHEAAGLILGGGNTKLQPRWSNFTSGDISGFRHREGDEKPDFLPPPGVVHVPSAARLLTGEDFGVRLDYGAERASIRLRVLDANRLEYSWQGPDTMTAHLTLLPRKGQNAPRTSEGSVVLGAARVGLPPSASVLWPVLPHDPYRKDGRSSSEQGRIVIDAPPSGKTIIEVRPGQ